MRSIAWAVAVVTLGAGLWAQSSGKILSDVKKSWTFTSTDIFYPGGVNPGAEVYPRLPPSSLRELEKSVQQHLKTVGALHDRMISRLKPADRAEFKQPLQAKVFLLNEGRPVARSLINEKGKLEVVLDVRVLQANFRASLAAGLREPSKGFGNLSTGGAAWWEEKKDEEKKPKRPPPPKPPANLEKATDDEMVSYWLQFKKYVEQAPSGNAWGDVFGAFRDLENNRWVSAIDLSLTASNVALHYSGTLLFILTHEIGHLVLGHHGRAYGEGDCAQFRADEYAADEYAVLILTPQFMPLGSMSAFSVFQNPAALTGVDTFLEYAYRRIGFVETRDSKNTCEYPSPAERKKQAEATKEKVLEQIDKGIWERATVKESKSKE